MHIQQEYDEFPEKATGPGHFEENSAKRTVKGTGEFTREKLHKLGDTERKVRSQRKHGLIKKKNYK